MKQTKVLKTYYHQRFYELKQRIVKHLRSGRFYTYSFIRQHQLLSRLQRYARQLGLPGIGLAALMGMTPYQGNSQPMGAEFQVNAFTGGNQSEAAVASRPDGAFVIAYSSADLDADGLGVYRHLYDGNGNSIGGELPVNTHTTSDQSNPAVAMDEEGNFVVAWESAGQDGSGGGIYAQRFSALGIIQGAELLVNTHTTSNQFDPALAMDEEGNFVVVWESVGQDGSSSGIYAQRFSALGIIQGAEFKVNTFTTGAQRKPAVAMDEDGDFVIAWESSNQDGDQYGVFAQRYFALGTANGGEFQVNTYTTNRQDAPSTAMDEEGNFVIAWRSIDQDGSNSGVYAQRYSSAGVDQGSEFLVNTYTTSGQDAPSIALDASGDFTIAWTSYNQDGSSNGIYAQRYSAIGTTVGVEVLINSYTTSSQSKPALAIDADGDFVVAWQSLVQDGSDYGVYAQRYLFGTGKEFQVNDFTVGDQKRPAIAMDADGDYVITWESSSQDGSSIGIYAQRYSVADVPLGLEFRVNTFTVGDQRFQSIAMDADGDYVITWMSDGQDGDLSGVYAQRYSAEGVPLGLEFRVNTFTVGDQRFPSIAMDSDGDFVIVWEGFDPDGSNYGIFAQRYSAQGTEKGGEFQVNTFTTIGFSGTSIAMDADGNFVITWTSSGQDGSFSGVYAQRYSALGIPLGSEFQVNTFTTGNQASSRIAMDADGDFVITWGSNGQDGSTDGVYAQRYSATGTTLGGEFRVNTFTGGIQARRSIAMNADGDFAITWHSSYQDGSNFGVYAQRYSALGTPLGREFQVNAYTTDFQGSPSIAMDEDGDFVIAWSSEDQDGDLRGILAQRYAGKFPSTCESAALNLMGKDMGDKNYLTQGTIGTTQNILKNANVMYQSPLNINFNPNFEIQEGARMKAQIDNCNN